MWHVELTNTIKGMLLAKRGAKSITKTSLCICRVILNSKYAELVLEVLPAAVLRMTGDDCHFHVVLVGQAAMHERPQFSPTCEDPCPGNKDIAAW